MQLVEKKPFEVIDGGRTSPLESARWWAERGYNILPIAYRQKRPEIPEWQTLRLKPADLPEHFRSPQMNVGLILGEPYGVTDIDLDSPEALKIWQTFAPPTKCIFGHQSKPFSHFLYCMDPAGPSLKFSDPVDKTTLLELRCLSKDGSPGLQTVVPTSTHKDSGELIRFERGLDGAPANVDAEVLIRAAKKTAAASVLARHYPPAGSGRHDCELALAGVLARAAWTEPDAKEFVIAVYTSAQNHDRTALSRVSQAVEDTFRKLGEGADVTGIPRLLALIDRRAVEAGLEWLEIGRCAEVEIDASNWREHLLRNKLGIVRCVENVLVALHDNAWDGVIGFNESALRVEMMAPPPWDPDKKVPAEWTDEDDVLVAAWMQRERIMVPKEIVGQAIQTVARDHPVHPIKEYLEGLTWDGIGRIDDWLTLYLGADPSDYVRAVGAKFLVGAVARIFQPGCKNDCCPVLEGPQGLYKSTAVKILSTPWFTDEVADLGSKDSAMQVHGVWIIEIAELDAMTKSDVSKVKAFMSRSVDRFRPPYGKHVISAPRESVFFGTVNPGIKYLKDETGGRRFWPVKCGRINLDELKRDRDQLWAEAVVRYNAGATWWMDTSELNTAAEKEQAERYDEDPWTPKIAEYIKNEDSVAIRDILEHCLRIPLDRWTKPDKNRVAATLRFLGWKDRRSGPRGQQEWRFFRPDV